MNPTQLSQLTLLRSLCHNVIDAGKKATPGPWKCEEPDPVPLLILSDVGVIVSTNSLLDEDYYSAMTRRGNDTAFIALTRNLSPAFAEVILLLLDAMDYGCKCEPAEEKAWFVKCICCQKLEAALQLIPTL